MKNNTYSIFIRTVIACFLFGQAVIADDQVKKDDENAKRESPVIINNIFKEIMETLPADVKADLDSVKNKKTVKQTKSSNNQSSSKEKLADKLQHDKRLKELPEKIRQQVEKTIKEIEAKREERELQFKEMKKKKNKD